MISAVVKGDRGCEETRLVKPTLEGGGSETCSVDIIVNKEYIKYDYS